MDLIVWRHAEAFEAEPGEDDMNRVLTSRGKKQAERMAVWLESQLPQGTRILSSPAVRAEQTVRALEIQHFAPDLDAYITGVTK